MRITEQNVFEHMTARRTQKDYKDLALQKGLIFVGIVPKSVHARTSWRCSYGHTFETSHASLRQSKLSGCPFCSNKAPRKPSEYEQLALRRGLKWLGPNVRSVLSKSMWQCDKGHKPFAACFNSLTRESRGNGCRVCAGRMPKTVRDYRLAARSTGKRWIGKAVPLSTSEKTAWKCLACGSEWDATYSNIVHNKSGCPACVDIENGFRVSKEQRAIHSLVGGVINHRCGPYAIDVAMEHNQTRIAIEYDSWFWHSDDELTAERDAFLLRSGWRVLHILANSSVPSIEQLRTAISAIEKGDSVHTLQLSDWGGRARKTAAKHGRIAPVKQAVLSRPGIEIVERPENCYGVLEGRKLTVCRSSDNSHLGTIRLSPSEAKLVASAIESRRRRKDELRVHGTTDAISVMRRRIAFVEHNGFITNFITGKNKNGYSITIPIRLKAIKSREDIKLPSVRRWRTFEAARELVRSLKLPTIANWRKWAKSKKRPKNIPSNPQKVYRDSGWSGWADWLGKHEYQLKWSLKEDEVVRRHNVTDAVRILGRSLSAVYNRRHVLKTVD